MRLHLPASTALGNLAPIFPGFAQPQPQPKAATSKKAKVGSLGSWNLTEHFEGLRYIEVIFSKKNLLLVRKINLEENQWQEGSEYIHKMSANW